MANWKGFMRYLTILLLLLSGCVEDYVKPTVKVTSLEGHPGGSGVIVRIGTNYSEILTNGHVCELIKNGGLVHTQDDSSYLVDSYRISNIHDMCLIRVNTVIGTPAIISQDAPKMFDSATISGHPRLRHTTITKGKFKRRLKVTLIDGVRPCDKLDYLNIKTRRYCYAMNLVPVTAVYDAQLVDAIVEPGSSGSGVYDDKDQLVALVFAMNNNKDTGYAYVITYEYMRVFLDFESKNLPDIIPSNKVGTL